MKISVLVDNSDSWFVRYLPKIKKLLEKYGKNIYLCNSISKLKKRDILFILSCDKVLKRKDLLLHKSNIVIHASNLPKNRGWSPWIWQVERGENIIPITLFEAEERVDSGKLYIKDKIFLDGTELIEDIREKLAQKIIRMMKKYLDQYPMKGIAQKGNPTYNRKRKPEDNQIDVRKNLATQFNKIRVADNERYPAYFLFKGNKYILKVYRGK